MVQINPPSKPMEINLSFNWTLESHRIEKNVLLMINDAMSTQRK